MSMMKTCPHCGHVFIILIRHVPAPYVTVSSLGAIPKFGLKLVVDQMLVLCQVKKLSRPVQEHYMTSIIMMKTCPHIMQWSWIIFRGFYNIYTAHSSGVWRPRGVQGPKRVILTLKNHPLYTIIKYPSKSKIIILVTQITTLTYLIKNCIFNF